MTTDTVGRVTARRGLMLVVLAAALWGTSGVATKTIYTLRYERSRPQVKRAAPWFMGML
jgi:hypothetical protein